MIDSWAELRQISDAELIRHYDTIAKQTQVGLDFYRQEIAARNQEHTDKVILRYTKQVTALTWATTILSVAAVIISLLSLLVSLHPHY